MKFTNCPRCNRRWEHNCYCSVCDILYTHNDNIRWIIDFVHYLYWLFEKDCCELVIYSKIPMSLDKTIRLPLLPFNITRKQLKLYLTVQ